MTTKPWGPTKILTTTDVEAYRLHPDTGDVAETPHTIPAGTVLEILMHEASDMSVRIPFETWEVTNGMGSWITHDLCLSELVWDEAFQRTVEVGGNFIVTIPGETL